jgi:hypothetical protein
LATFFPVSISTATDRFNSEIDSTSWAGCFTLITTPFQPGERSSGHATFLARFRDGARVRASEQSYRSPACGEIADAFS